MACVGIKDSDRNIPENIKKIDENERKFYFIQNFEISYINDKIQ